MTKKRCKRGEVWSKREKRCVPKPTSIDFAYYALETQDGEESEMIESGEREKWIEDMKKDGLPETEANLVESSMKTISDIRDDKRSEKLLKDHQKKTGIKMTKDEELKLLLRWEMNNFDYALQLLYPHTKRKDLHKKDDFEWGMWATDDEL